MPLHHSARATAGRRRIEQSGGLAFAPPRLHLLVLWAADVSHRPSHESSAVADCSGLSLVRKSSCGNAVNHGSFGVHKPNRMTLGLCSPRA